MPGPLDQRHAGLPQRDRRPRVRPAAAAGGRVRVHGAGEQRVPEPQPAGALLGAQQVPRDQLVDRVLHRRRPGDRRQPLRVEGRPEHGGGVRDLAGGRVERLQLGEVGAGPAGQVARDAGRLPVPAQRLGRWHVRTEQQGAVRGGQRAQLDPGQHAGGRRGVHRGLHPAGRAAGPVRQRQQQVRSLAQHVDGPVEVGAVQDQQPAGAGPLAQRRQQPGLADARLAGDHDRAEAGPDGEHPVEDRELADPPDQADVHGPRVAIRWSVNLSN